MNGFVLSGFALLVAVGSAYAQTAPTTTAPSQPAGISGAAPSAVSRPAASPATGAAATAQTGSSGTPSAASGSNGKNSGNGVFAPSNAPVANSKVVISGADASTTKPSEDHPMLPIAPVGNSLGIRSGTPISVQLQQRADSGHLHNGDVVKGTLATPIAGLSRGTPVQLTVVQASQAGALTSAGELSLQVTRIGKYDVLSVIVTALGQEGKKELVDAAPAPGTEAEFPASQTLSFPAS